MIEGSLYPLPILKGTLSNGVVYIPFGDTLTEMEKELLKSLVYGPGDNMVVMYDLAAGVSISNDSPSVSYGSPYSTVITCEPLKAVSSSVFMGDTNVGEEYKTVTSYCEHRIDIPSVTEPIRITARATSVILRISAVYNQTSEVHSDTDLDDLRNDLVVKGGIGGSLPYILTDYTLNGDLEVGTSTITVDFYGKTTTFNVTVT